MGLSSPNLPNANLEITIKSQYIEIDKLLKLAKDSNKLEIRYNRLDGVTVNELRKAIASVVHVYDYKRIESESVAQELKRLFVLNMSDTIDIDFAKLVDSTIDPIYDYSFLLRKEIISVLMVRKTKVYNNMILNPTI